MSPDAAAITCILTAMSLLALLGLRYPLGMVPILIFEVLWKLMWLALVALPHVIANDVDAAMSETLFSVSFVVLIIAVTPWDYVVNQFVVKRGEPWTPRGKIG